MIIYNPNGTTLLDIEVDDTSAAYAEVMNRDDVTLEFSLAEYVEIPVGAYISFQNRNYWVFVPPTVTVVNRRNYQYSAVFETDFGKLSLWYLHNPVDGRVKFDLTARPSEHLAMIVANLNEREGSQVWEIAPGSYDSSEVSLAYNKTRLRDALAQLAEDCETEFEVFRSGAKVYISLGKVEYNADSPISLSYGSEGGFESGVKRMNDGGGLPIQVLYVQGGDRNIDPSTYYNRSHYLLLPRAYSFSFDGEKFNGESGYQAAKAVAMVTDENGYSVKLASATRGAAEESLDLSDIYPKRVGTISAVTTEQSKGDYPFYNIEDNGLGKTGGRANINFNDYMIEGETFTVVFQSGMLVGREIGVHKYTLENGKGIFELAQETIDGFIMPGEGGYVPAVGDTYAVFGCALPAAYISSSSNHSGAEFEMLRKAAKFLYENKDAKQSFKGTLSSVFARKNWQTLGPKIVLGGYVSFTDDSVQSSAVSMRIKAVKTYINRPFKPEIELSNEMSAGTVGGSIQSLYNNHAHTDRQFRDAQGYTNRRWRDAKESQDLLAEALLEEFTEGISPVTIQTMSALVGSTNLQYEIFTTNAYTAIQATPYFNAAGNLVCQAGYVRHYTLGFDENAYVKTNRANTEYYRWRLTASTLSLTDEVAYYLYIAASKITSATEGTATYLLSRTAIPFAPTSAGSNYDANHYYLLYATISSESEGGRSIATFNGFTEITPGMIRAMKWISNDGQQFIDFVNKSFRVGDANKFFGYNVDANGQYDGQGRLRLKGTMVQSPAGTTFPVPCFRGEYRSNIDYYYGDEVTYNGQSWLHIGETSTRGTAPSEGAVWTLYAAKGTNGGVNESRYQWGTNPSTPPTYDANSQNPGNNWKTSPPNRTVDGSYLWSISAMRDASGTYGPWGNPVRMTGDTGTAGEDAKEREWIYKLNASNPGTPTNPTDRTIDDYVPSGWSDNPSGVTNSSKTEWASYRDFNHTTDKWGDFSAPIIWSHYGERGMDGDGVEYVYARTTTNSAPSITNDSYNNTESNYNQDEFLPHVTGATTTSATDDPQGVTASYPYEWVAKRTKAAADANGVRKWEKYSGSMSLWANHADDGKGINEVNEYYAASTNGSSAPADSAFTKNAIPSNFNITNKYLWNYEEIVYTTGNPVKTPKTVIGVYGKDGKGLTAITEYYLASEISSGVTRSTSGWTTTMQYPDASKPYLWNYERLTWDDNGSTSYTYTDPAIIGYYGKDGDAGKKGKSIRGVSDWLAGGWGGSGAYQGEADSGNASIDGDFIDVVAWTVPGDSEVSYFWCKKTHQSASITPSNSTYWEQMNYFSLVATHALIADYVAAKQVSVDSLNTGLSAGKGDNIVTIDGNAIQVLDSSGKPKIEISTNDLPSGSGTVGNITKSGSLGAYAGVGSKTYHGTVFSALEITDSSNTVTVSGFTASMTYYSGSSAIEIDDSVDIVVYLEHAVSGVRITLANYEGNAHNHATTTATARTLTNLASGSWNCYADFSFNGLASGNRMRCDVSTITISGQYTTPSTSRNVLAGNGFLSEWGQEGIKVTSSAAQVKHGGNLYDILGGANGIKAIQIVTGNTYPTAVDGVLYIKVTANS